MKFIISGSASVQITKKAKESLAGRVFDFLLEPLTFKEFLEWKNIKYDVKRIELFEREITLKIVANYRKGFLVSSRKKRKVYIANTAISFTLAENFYSDKFLEKIAENFAVLETNARNYYRNKYEVDIILRKGEKIIPIEVKYGKAEITSMLKFLSEFKLKKALIITKDTFGKKIKDNKKVLLVPLWAFLLAKEDYIKQLLA